jgi:hypothetical protein
VSQDEDFQVLGGITTGEQHERLKEWHSVM